ncbi:hypothetical protein L1887_45536 [Cichorium endivia]|nr:hypothetical protein L1887_45536 [Cichorium endivia]
MAHGADDHLMAPHRIGQPRVNDGKTRHRFNRIEQVKATRNRQPAHRQREEQRQQQRQPEYRDGEAEQGEGADKLILPFVAIDPGQHTHRDTDHQGKAEGQNAQLHRGRENLFQLIGNQLAVNAGHAEIPVQQPVKPEQPGIPQRRPLERGVGREIAQAEADKVQEKERHQQQKEPT